MPSKAKEIERTGPRARMLESADQLSPDDRARVTEQEMTDRERLSLVFSLMPVAFTPGGHVRDARVPRDVPQTAGWVAGVPRLGIPALLITDAGLGVTNPGLGRPGDTATALPAGLALGATFDLTLARESGALVGREARARGFNVLCGGGINLPRDPRCGRNFEYLSEDPWHAAVMAAETVIGTQSEGVISMLKHLSLNAHETNKFWLDALIDPVAHRESDLLAFQIAIERAEPGSIMGAYNKLNGEYCCGNEALLTDIIKNTIGFKGFIMSDWKAVHHWDYALKGLDQQSGAQLDEQEWFIEPLRKAFADGTLPKERLSDMVRRILRSIYAVGIDQWAAPLKIDMAAHDASALEVARRGIVLLKNDGVLPIARSVQRIAVIGGHAQLGVLAELRRLRRDATVTYDRGAYPAEAAALARRCEIAIVVATKFETEGFDAPDLSLPFGQDALIEAVATANPNTIVVLETGNPIAMPWRDKVRAIVEAWYPGQAGGRAIAEILTGAVNPSGRLPMTFPADVAQLPRPELAGFGTPIGTPLTVEYNEGAEVGYRWFAHTGAQPLYPFGHGLSYTTFSYSDLDLVGGDTITARFVVTNTGARDGAVVPQLYLVEAPGERRMRLLGFERIQLRPGETRRVALTVEPRLLARFDGTLGHWRIVDGNYRVALGKSAGELVLAATASLTGRTFGK